MNIRERRKNHNPICWIIAPKLIVAPQSRKQWSTVSSAAWQRMQLAEVDN
jgi:hypothetical protein